MEDRTLLSTFTVINTDDSGPGSLRQVILDSNAATGGTNTIDFQIPEQGVQMIAPASSLPAISNPVLIDGFSQPGYGGTPLIEINGLQVGTGDGLTITGPDVTVRGLDINKFSQGAGIHITGTSAIGDWIYGDFLGTDPTGTQAAPNNDGVEIDAGAAEDLCGTNGDGVNDAIEGNLLSGNSSFGAFIVGPGTDGNVVAGNKVGTDVTGTLALGTSGAGVEIANGASSNTIGGTAAAEGNLITDNGGPGVVVGAWAGDACTGNQVTANRLFGNTGQAVDLGGDGVTYDASAPRQGPNNLQNFPVIFATAEGRLQGWLGGSTPNTTFRIDVFASAAYGPGGAGEAEDYLGSMQVMTDSQGQAVFDVPYAPPAGLPIVTATATDPQGNTSEVSALRRATLDAPSQSVRAVADQSLTLANTSSDGIGIHDLDAGPTSPSWDLTLSVSDGTLTLASASGLTGSGDGTGSLSYVGSLSALDAALNGSRYTPPPGPHVLSILTLNARSYGAPPLGTEFAITDGVAVVTTTADGGPGSLRQAILDANSVIGETVTIDFAIPGAGVQTIEPLSPLPPVTVSLLIDGASQPGFAGAPLIALGGQSAGSSGALAISAANVNIRGLASDRVRIDATTDERLVAHVHAQGLATQLSLLESRGQVLVRSDGISSNNPENVIDQHLSEGTYFLEVQSLSGSGIYTLSTSLTPASKPYQTLSLPSNYQGGLFAPIAAGDFTNNGILDLVAPDGVHLGTGDGTFQAPSANSALVDPTTEPSAIAVGNFTGSHNLDAAVALAGTDSISIALGTGDGTFQLAETIALPAGSGPQAIVAGDFTGNGITDLAVAETGLGEVSLVLGNDHGTFQFLPPIPVGQAPDAITTGDFGNGHLDLAVTDIQSGDVTVLSNNGNGTFRVLPPIALPPGSTPIAIVAGDFGTGNVDLAVADSSQNKVYILQGYGDGTFRLASSVAVGPNPYAMVAGDFGNGHLDLAVADGNSSLSDISVLLGNGDGTFQTAKHLAAGLAPIGLAAGDFNGDGRTDLATANTSTNDIYVLLGKGDGTFQEPVAQYVGYEASALATGDFTSSGSLGLAVVNSGSDNVTILPGDGDGTFEQPLTVPLPAGSSASGVVAADFNRDGRTDLAVTDHALNEVSVLLGYGNGTFQSLSPIAVGGGPYAIATGDFTGDGIADLAVVDRDNSTVTILLGKGDGTFRGLAPIQLGEPGIPSSPDAIVTGDFTGDGHLDLAVADPQSDDVTLLLGNGDGTFGVLQPISLGFGTPTNLSLVADDFNGDGWLDLAVASSDLSNGDSLDVLLGNGDETFRILPPILLGYGVSPVSIVAGDFTGDGHLGLATADGNGNGTDDCSVYLGNGDGTFQAPTAISLGGAGFSTALVSGDFAGNGRTDLAIARTNPDDIRVQLNNGDGTFSDPPAADLVTAATPLVADVNGDGTDDVLEVDGTGLILYRQGVSGQAGTFEPPVTVQLPHGVRYLARDIAWVPNTLDGPLLASVDAQDDAVSLFAFRDGNFLRVGSLSTGRLPEEIIAADLNRDGWDDLVVRNAGDGTLSIFINNGFGSFATSFNPFLPPRIIPVGLGASDVIAIDSSGRHIPDLVVTNKLTGQVSVLRNWGDGSFATPVPYRAGNELSAVDPGSAPEVTSLDATISVAAGAITAVGQPDLITANPGSNTLALLAGLGGSRYANPIAIQTPGPAQAVRMADFAGKGVDDLAVLTANGVSIYLANSRGGFWPPVTYDIGPDSTGLAVADVNHDGELDLLVGDAFGDVLVLLGEGNGTFRPYREADQAIELAVADLTGTGSKDIIYADQGLDRVVVAYGAGQSTVLGDRSNGLLNPSAVELADLNGDGIPDLIVANSGGNDVLIYPGLGNDQFGPAVNGGHGDFSGTDPVGIAVADVNGDGKPDLVIADKGSNQVSILLNEGNFRFTAGARLNSGGSGPVSTMVGHFTGSPYPDLLVTNSGSNDVRLLPGVGQGFFNDTNPKTFAVGTNPVTSFVGNFDGQTDLITVNAGSNDLTVISGFEGPNPVTSTMTSGGIDPTTAFDFAAASGFEDLVVGNSGDGVLALFAGGPEGLSQASAASEPNLPEPTALAFAALTGGQVQFYAATAGREAAELVTLSLGIATEATSQVTVVAPVNTVAQLVALNESSASVPLVASVLTLTIPVSGTELNLGLVETETATLAAFVSGNGVSVGQGLASPGRVGNGGADEAAQSDEPGARAALAPSAIAPWERMVIGLDKALEEFRRENPGGLSGVRESSSGGDRSAAPVAPPSVVPNGPANMRPAAELRPSGGEPDPQEPSAAAGADAAIEMLWSGDEGGRWAWERTPHPPFGHPLPASGARGKIAPRDEVWGSDVRTPHPPFGHPLTASEARGKTAPFSGIRVSAWAGQDRVAGEPAPASRSLAFAAVALRWAGCHRSIRDARRRREPRKRLDRAASALDS
jgi:hypothetical protein